MSVKLKPLGFWGLVVEPNKMYSQTVPVSFQITMAALGPKVQAEVEQKGRNVLLLTHDKDGEFALCTLTHNLHEQQNLNLVFLEGESIHLRVDGESAVHLSGYYIDTNEQEMSESEYDAMSMDEDSEEEDADSLGEEDTDVDSEEDSDESEAEAETKVKRKSMKIHSSDEEEDEDDDSEYDSDFINDDTEEEDEEGFDSEDDDEDFDSEEDESEEEENVTASLKTKRAANEPAIVEQPVKKAKEEPKKDEPKKEISVKPEAKKEEPKKAEAKKEEPKKQEVKKETPKEIKKDTPKAEAKEVKETPSKQANSQQGTPQSAVKSLPSGIKWEDVQVGEGMKAQKGRRLGVVYTVMDESGKELASNRNKELLFFDLHSEPMVHKALHLAMNQMQQGGERVISIPSTFVDNNSRALPAIPKGKNVTVRVTLEKVLQK